jgi:hypothetical protein
VLLNHGANVNAEDSHYRTPLHRVFEGPLISEDGFGVIQLLLGAWRGCEQTRQIVYPHCTLHHTISISSRYGCSLTMARMSMRRTTRARPHCTECSINPLHLQRCFGIVQLLVERGANVNTRDKDHSTPLHLASFRQHLELVQVLLNHGANYNAKDSMGRTPLHQVLVNPFRFQRWFRVVQILLGVAQT